MTRTLTRYIFLVKQDGWAEDDPHYDKQVRQFDSDAQAELHASRISADHHGAWVTIRRGGASWQRVVRFALDANP